MSFEKKTGSRLLKLQVLTTAFILVAAYGLFLWSVLPENRFVLTITSEIEVERVGIPVNIKIPSIALEADIVSLGLTANGSMDVPSDPFDTGWYELGARPGEPGTAVIDGHVNWWYGTSAVFANLHKLKLGDSIMVQDEWGTTTTFVVREIRSFDASADASAIFNSSDGMAHLNLITCWSLGHECRRVCRAIGDFYGWSVASIVQAAFLARSR